MFLQNKRRKNKTGFEMPFSWLFAIIAGAFIILISIYVTVRIINVGKQYDYAANAKTISNILDPVVNGLASASAYPPIEFNKETRVYLDCDTHFLQSPVFGRQTIAFSEESGLIAKWAPPGSNISRYNKYIFGEKLMQGKKYYIFSKPFYLGYKVDDLIYIMPSSDNYCFVRAPDSISYEMNSFAFNNINLTTNLDSCPKNSIITCFDFQSQKCEISISYYNPENPEAGRISKAGKNMDYTGDSMLYAGIFSSPDIYECNIARLGTKISLLGKIYKDKIDIVKTKECGSIIEPYINEMISNSENLTSSKLANLNDLATSMDELNCKSNCPIYGCQGS